MTYSDQREERDCEPNHLAVDYYIILYLYSIILFVHVRLSSLSVFDPSQHTRRQRRRSLSTPSPVDHGRLGPICGVAPNTSKHPYPADCGLGCFSENLGGCPSEMPLTSHTKRKLLAACCPLQHVLPVSVGQTCSAKSQLPKITNSFVAETISRITDYTCWCTHS